MKSDIDMLTIEGLTPEEIQRIKAEGIDVAKLIRGVLESLPDAKRKPPVEDKTLELLAQWQVEDAMDDPEELEHLDKETSELMQNLQKKQTFTSHSGGMMTSIVVLDSTPLGLVTQKPGRSSEVDSYLQWIADLTRSGWMIRVPEIADYEVRRELPRFPVYSSGSVDEYKPLSISMKIPSKPNFY